MNLGKLYRGRNSAEIFSAFTHRVFKAVQVGDERKARSLQKLILKSTSARFLAIRLVSQLNAGKKTAGIDGKKSLSFEERFNLEELLKMNSGNWKHQGLREIPIPKKDGTTRMLKIPVMNDRALQALIKMALEPEWEARFEPNSYGFRPGRSCHDAIKAIFLSIAKKSKYVLDADIAKCFDRIDHEALLIKLNTFPTIRRQVRAWLKAGVMDGKQLFPTSEGTPQGGVISPLLANIALHGMEERIDKTFPEMSYTSRETWYHKKGTKFRSPRLIRYADDFVILHEDITVVQRCTEIISEWLKDMGLELKPSKTRLTHTLNEYETEKPGFNFLGFNVKQWKVGKYHSKQGFKTIITPSSYKQKIHYDRVASIIDDHKAAPQSALISNLNPVITGWSKFYSTVVSSVVYSTQDHLMYLKLRAWAKRRHNKKNGKWLAKKYWQTIGGNNWVFANKQKGKNPIQLRSHAETSIVLYVKVNGEASPYDGNLIYWSSRMGKHPEVTKRVATLLKKQKGKCTHCQMYFRESDVLEIDHITPKNLGGKDEYKNLQILHRHCHDEKTTEDGSVVKYT